jgi:glycosyltransferase involved in cell wall biosynthesis
MGRFDPVTVRILHVVDLPVENPWLNGIADHYDRDRYRHTVVTLGPESELHHALRTRGLSARALGVTRKRGYPVAVLRLRSLLRRERIDVVQTHLFYPSIIGLIAAAAAGTPVKLVTRHHSDFTTTFHHPVHRQLDRLQAHWADRVLAASDAVKLDMIRYEKVPPDKITVTRYGYDFNRLQPCLSSERRVLLRAQLGGHQRVIVATVARLSPSKGHRYLLQAARGLVARHPELIFVWVGTGPLRSELQALVDGAGLTDHVRILGWRDDAWSIIEASDLVVHPTLHEAFCSVIIESMALERPVVATDVAAAREQIDDNQTGLIVPSRNPEAIEAAVEQVLAHPEQSRRMGVDARASVVARFNFPKMMDLYESIYDDVLALV